MPNSLTQLNKTLLAKKPQRTLTTKPVVTPPGNNNKPNVTQVPTSREDFQTLNSMRTWADCNRFNAERTTL